MRTATVTFRGQEVEVEYRDHGYESDTNAHEIDWHFIEKILQDVELTDGEEQSIYDQLVQISYDRYED